MLLERNAHWLTTKSLVAPLSTAYLKDSSVFKEIVHSGTCGTLNLFIWETSYTTSYTVKRLLLQTGKIKEIVSNQMFIVHRKI